MIRPAVCVSGSTAHQAQILAKRRLVQLVHNELDLRHGRWPGSTSKDHVSPALGVEAGGSMRARILLCAAGSGVLVRVGSSIPAHLENPQFHRRTPSKKIRAPIGSRLHRVSVRSFLHFLQFHAFSTWYVFTFLLYLPCCSRRFERHLCAIYCYM